MSQLSYEPTEKRSLRQSRDGVARKQVALDCCDGRIDRRNEDLVERPEVEVVIEFGLERLLVSNGN